MDRLQWLPVPGVRLAAVKAGIKKPDRLDLVLLELCEGAYTAGVFTRNRFCAAPVHVARSHLKSASPRYLLINTGYANAGTGEQGMANCKATCDLVARGAECSPEQVLPFSTGVIGEQFSLPPFERGIPQALAGLDADNWADAAHGIMTTDTRAKLASVRHEIDHVPVTITGMSKGSGMIKPDMATMLAFVCCDAPVAPALLSSWSKRLADESFNRITVDGDTSTNDALMLVATGRAALEPISDDADPRARALYEHLRDVCITLAQAIVRDGEGATKFLEIRVTGAASDADARSVAETVAHSPLVKTALYASDPNWGRILAAVGRAPVSSLDVDRVSIALGDVPIVENGGVADSYREADGSRVMAGQDIVLSINLGEGSGQSTVWTCDFSYDYVRINAEYRT